MGLGQSEHPVLTRRSGVCLAPHRAGENDKAARQIRGSGGGVSVELTGYPVSHTSLRVGRRKLPQAGAAAELGSVRVTFMKP